MKVLKALLVDSQKHRPTKVADALKSHNLPTTLETSLARALIRLRCERYEALFVAEQQPEEQLGTFCRDLRRDDPDMVIVASVSDPSGKLESELFDCGVDDVVRPETPADVIAKRVAIRLIERSQGRPDGNVVHLGDTIVNFETFEVWSRGRLRSISKGLAKLLKYLIANRGRIITRNEASEILWADSVVDPAGKNLDVQVSKLRRLLESDPASPEFIQTVRGVGYRFVPRRYAKH